MSTDLADNATHEEITEYVDQVVANVEKDREGEQAEDKTDSQRVAEDHDEPVTEPTTAETDSGSEDTAKGEETGPEDQAEDWLDDDLKAEVAAYGIDEKELADFTSREELERALRFFDRSALEAGRKALAEGGKTQATEPARNEQGRFTKSKEEEPREGQFEVSLDKDVYDEGLVEELTRMRDHYESRFDAFESRFAEADARAEEQRFDAAIDAMGHPDLFGKTGKESPKELGRRQDVIVASKAQILGLQLYGREVGPDQYDSLVSRIARMVFAEELGKKELKARTVKVSKQGDGRMGGGSTKAPDPKETRREWVERRYEELDNV